jgi:hypothetical protein
MKTLSAIIVILAMVAGTGFAWMATVHGNTRPSEVSYGAYRDGMYLGRLAAKDGEAPHIASGRWSADEDRASFSAGYEHGYTETTTASRDSAHASAAFRDGLFLGSLAAKRGDQARLSVGRWATDGDRALFAEGYRQAYSEATAVQIARVSARKSK